MTMFKYFLLLTLATGWSMEQNLLPDDPQDGLSRTYSNKTLGSAREDRVLPKPLNEKFIKWVDIKKNQEVSENYVVVSSSELTKNMKAINRFFAQNPHKTLFVDLGDAKAIGDCFTIPKKVQHLTIMGQFVTTVGDDFLGGCKGLRTLDLSHLPLTKVGNYFLAKCVGLRELILPQSMTIVGHHFLYKCIALTQLDLSHMFFKKVGDYFLAKCTGLKQLNLSHMCLKTLGNCFLFMCKSLTQLSLPKYLTKADDFFLFGCSELSTLHLPESMTTIGHGFLYKCAGLRELILPLALTTVGDGFLEGCESLTQLSLPKYLTKAGDFFLHYCIRLTQLTLSQGQEKTLRLYIDALKSANPSLKVIIQQAQ
jgi:hypothetical protein